MANIERRVRDGKVRWYARTQMVTAAVTCEG